MNVEGSVKVRAPSETVWDVIFDLEKLARVFPGMERIRIIDDKTYEAELKVRIGIFRVSFSVTAKVIEIDPPSLVKLIMEGKDRITGTTINAKTTVKLQPVPEVRGETETELTYASDVNVVGRLAELGESVMRAKSEQMKKQFEENLQNLVRMPSMLHNTMMRNV